MDDPKDGETDAHLINEDTEENYMEKPVNAEVRQKESHQLQEEEQESKDEPNDNDDAIADEVTDANLGLLI